ncbi:MAG: AMP-binding protein [Armatimonadota bacterium]|nr:AMP-binding protein [Armatimonadota bacterium]
MTAVQAPAEVKRRGPREPLEVSPDLDTLPKLLMHNAQRFGHGKVAFREKEMGIWQGITWQEYLNHVRTFSLGLVELGFQKGEVLAIIGDNRPELYYAALGAQAAGGISYALYQDSLAEQLAILLDFSDARFVFCEDQEQADKVLEMEDRLPKIVRIIVDDWRGMWRYRDPKLISFQEVERLGEEASRRDPGRFAAMVSQGKGDDVAIFCQTSGTTALPKLAMLTYRNLLSQACNFRQVEAISERDEFVSYLPFAWIGEQMISVSLHLLAGFTVNFPEEPETAQRDFREIGPHFTFAPPRIWEGIHSSIMVRIMDSGWVRRRIFDLAMHLGERFVHMESEGKPLPFWLKLARLLSYWLVYRPVLDKAGLRRMRVAWTGGAALGPDYFKFFRALGLNLKQIYGQTEIAGISCVHRDGQVRFWTMGAPLPETEVRTTPEGEIVSRSPSVFLGYYKNPEATMQALRDGWLYSGDYGAIDPSGDVICFDRMGDVIELSDGSKVGPQVIENMLKFTPYIQEAMVVGGKERPYIAAILNIDMRNVGKWAEDRGIAYTSYTDLSQKPEVLDLLGGIVAEVNRRLRPEWRIRRFVSLYKEFHPDDDELTRTRKLRRRFIAERYKDLIEALFSDQETYQATFTVRYEDGRIGEIRPVLLLRSVKE